MIHKETWVKYTALAFIVLLLPLTSVVPQERSLQLERIEFKGNTKTDESVLLRYLRLRPGDRVTADKVDRDWQALAATDFFKSVELYTRPGSRKGLVVLVVEVTERRWPYFQFEGGHSDLDGWYFVPFSLRFDNLFGKGHEWNFQAYLSDRFTRLGFNYHNPDLLSSSLAFDLQFYGGTRTFILYIDGQELNHDVDVGGIDMKLSGTEGIFRYLFLRYNNLNFSPARTAAFVDTDSVLTISLFPKKLAVQIEDTTIASLTAGIQIDRRDNVFYPMRGFWGVASAGLAHSELGSKIDFVRYRFDARIYQRIFRRHVLAFNVKAGSVSREAPFYQRFYLGGANSLRGYPERRLTPIGYGARHFLTSIEYRFPFSSRQTGTPGAVGVFFFDAGGLWNTDEKIDSDGLYRAFGFGLRLKIPIIGLTRIDFAFPLDKFEDNDFQLHFSLGHAF